MDCSCSLLATTLADNEGTQFDERRLASHHISYKVPYAFSSCQYRGGTNLRTRLEYRAPERIRTSMYPLTFHLVRSQRVYRRVKSKQILKAVLDRSPAEPRNPPTYLPKLQYVVDVTETVTNQHNQKMVGGVGLLPTRDRGSRYSECPARRAPPLLYLMQGEGFEPPMPFGQQIEYCRVFHFRQPCNKEQPTGVEPASTRVKTSPLYQFAYGCISTA